MKLRQILIAAVGLAIAAGSATAASADTQWQKHHPRREEVNTRLTHLNRSITRDRRAGEISPSQARYLHARDHAVRAQERYFASKHHGHITRAEQHRLNHEETGVRHHIG